MYSIYSLVAQLVKKICLQSRRHRFNHRVGKIPWRRAWRPTPAFLPGEFHGWTNLVGGGPWGHKHSDTNEHTHRHIYKTISSIVSRYLKQYNCLFLYFISRRNQKKIRFQFYFVLKWSITYIKNYCLLLILHIMPVALLFILLV